MKIENWKDIPGYKGVYRASNYGKVKRLTGWQCKKERILKPNIDKNGYLCVGLYKNGKIKMCKIHRLVLEAFVGPCPPGMQCRHLDGNPSNNILDNLCWGIPEENQADRKVHGTANIGEYNGRSKLNEKQIKIIKWLFKNSDMTDLEIAKIFNVSHYCIYSIRNNKTWKHVKGF